MLVSKMFHNKYLKDYGKKFASTSLDHYQGLTEWTPS